LLSGHPPESSRCTGPPYNQCLFFIDTKRHALSFGRLVHYFDLNDKTHDILDCSLSDRMIIDRNIPDIRAKHRVILIFQKPVVNQVFIVSYALFADSDSDGISLEISITGDNAVFCISAERGAIASTIVRTCK